MSKVLLEDDQKDIFDKINNYFKTVAFDSESILKLFQENTSSSFKSSKKFLLYTCSLITFAKLGELDLAEISILGVKLSNNYMLPVFALLILLIYGYHLMIDLRDTRLKLASQKIREDDIAKVLEISSQLESLAKAQKESVAAIVYSLFKVEENKILTVYNAGKFYKNHIERSHKNHRFIMFIEEYGLSVLVAFGVSALLANYFEFYIYHCEFYLILILTTIITISLKVIQKWRLRLLK